MADRISSIIDPEALNDLIKAAQLLRELNQEVAKSAQSNITIVNSSAPSNIQGLVEAINKLTEATEKTTQATDRRKSQLSEIEKLEARITYLTTEEAKAVFQLRGEVLELSTVQRNAAKDANDVGGAYGRLSREFTQAALSAKNMVIELGHENEAAQKAIQSANALNDRLKALDAMVGQHNRTVGNYSVATAGLNNSIQQIARELPSISNGFATFASAIGNNIAPAQDAIKRFTAEQKDLQAQGKPTQTLFQALSGAVFNYQSLLLVGVTLLTVYGKQIGEFASKLFQAKSELDKLSASEKRQYDQRKAIAETYGQEIAKLEVLRAKIQDVNTPMDQRIGFVKEIQALLPQYFGQLNQEAILAGKVGDAYERAATAIQSAARVRVFGEKLGGVEGEIASLGDRIASQSARGGVEVNRSPLALPGQEAPFMVPSSSPAYKTGEVDKNGKPVISDLIRDTRRYNELLQQRLDLTQKIQKNATNAATAAPYVDPSKPGTTRDGFAGAMAVEKDLTAAIYDELIIRADGEARHQKRVAENEKNSLQDRLIAFDQYTSLQLRSLYLNEAKQREVIQGQLEEIERIEAKSADKRTQSERNLLARKGLLQQQLANVVATTQEKQTDIIEGAEKAQTKIVEDEAEKQRKIKEGLQVKQRSDPNNRMVGRTQSPEEAREEERRIQQARLDTIESYTRQSISATESLFDIERARSQERIAGLQREIELINQKRDADIKAIDDTFLTDAEKKRRIAEINAKAAAETEVQEEKIRQQRRRSAELEKALAIAKIIINTALAVAAQLTIPGAGIGFAIAAAAAGAAQLAAVIATPIPQFRTGKGEGNDYEGLAVVGDGGPELVLREDGSAQLVDKETMTYLRKNDVVKTSKETHDIFRYMALGMPALRTRDGKEYPMDELLGDVKDGIVTAIKGQRFPTQKSRPAWFDAYAAKHFS